jgi:hypothetical protein
MSNPGEPSKTGRNVIVGVVLTVLGGMGYALVQEMTKDAYNKGKEAAANADVQLPRLGTPCSKCGGTGWYTETLQPTPTGDKERDAMEVGTRTAEVKCPDCGGTGRQR